MATIDTARRSGSVDIELLRPPTATGRGDRKAVHCRVDSYSILNTMREAAFDRLVFTTAQIFRVPVALIGVVDGDHLWLKAQVGLAATEMPRVGVLDAVLEQDDVLMIEDVTRDTRFADMPSPVSRPAECRFFAGVPLITPDGLRVGCLCVMDRSSKSLLGKQVWQLAQLARSVTVALESRRPVGEDA